MLTWIQQHSDNNNAIKDYNNREEDTISVTVRMIEEPTWLHMMVVIMMYDIWVIVVMMDLWLMMIPSYMLHNTLQTVVTILEVEVQTEDETERLLETGEAIDLHGMVMVM